MNLSDGKLLNLTRTEWNSWILSICLFYFFCLPIKINFLSHQKQIAEPALQKVKHTACNCNINKHIDKTVSKLFNWVYFNISYITTYFVESIFAHSFLFGHRCSKKKIVQSANVIIAFSELMTIIAFKVSKRVTR